MSNFLKQGNRKAYKVEKKSLRKHTMAFYKIMNQMNTLALKLVEKEYDVTEDNIQKLALDNYGRELDDMEKMLVMSKIADYNNNKNE
jgi:hypothetical protein